MAGGLFGSETFWRSGSGELVRGRDEDEGAFEAGMFAFGAWAGLVALEVAAVAFLSAAVAGDVDAWRVF